MKKIRFSTDQEMKVVQLTEKVREKVKETEIKNGVAHVFVPHATGAIIVNESADPKVRTDIINKLKDLFPKGAGYEHDKIDGNAHSHLMSTFLGPSESVPVVDGDLELGTWQDISFVETDGPRSTRTVFVQVTEEIK